ncbi:MAG: class II aldolase/adducin family protein [Paracoccaceae bacterium]
MSVPHDLRALSARLGADPLQVQGPGGNTSVKIGGVLWVKASGTELSQALERDIFVPVDLIAAHAEALGAGDGTCRDAVLSGDLRPSIETTFHALIPQAVVLHTHSVAALAHGVSPMGRRLALERLAGLGAALVPYVKPGRDLTRAIASVLREDTRVLLLANHGLVVAGDDVASAEALLAEVERRLALTPCEAVDPDGPPPEGHAWLPGGAGLARYPLLRGWARAGSYWPDHVVFLGPALAEVPGAPAWLAPGGVAIRTDATPAQAAMARCAWDVLSRTLGRWTPLPIGPRAEAALLDWDAEKYRQALAARGAS